MYFVNFSTACIQLLKYVQVQIVLSDLPNLFYRCDLVNQLCLDILPPPPPPRGLVHIQIQNYFHLSQKQLSTGYVAGYIFNCSSAGYCHYHCKVDIYKDFLKLSILL